MTYYTIPYKSDGSCCPTCPTVQSCNCDENTCCDFDASYTGKTLTGHREAYSIGPGGVGSFVITDWTALTYAGGGAFTGPADIDVTLYDSDGGNGSCYNTGIFNSSFPSSYTDTITWYCVTSPFYYYNSAVGSGAYATANSVNCGYGVGCVDTDLIYTCTATYSSSCFSISYYIQTCTQGFVAGSNCTGESTYSWSRETSWWTIS